MTLLPRRRRRPAVLLAIALLCFLPLLGQRDVVTSHEARVVQTARQMAASGWPWEARPVGVPVVGLKELEKHRGILRLVPLAGQGEMQLNPWLVPIYNGSVRLQKPPLPYWCSAVLFKVFGIDFDEGAARLPAALMAAASVLLVFDLGRMLIGRAGAWLAGLVWVSSYFVFDEHRKALADPYLAFFTLLSIWAWIKGSGFGVQGSGQKHQRIEAPTHGIEVEPLPSAGAFPLSSLNPEPRTLNPSLVLIFYFSLALGALAKAPVNFLHVGLALGAFHLCYGRRPPGRWWHHVVGVGLFLAVALPWPVYVLSHVDHALELSWYESFGEFAENTEKARPWHYYHGPMLQASLPWTLVWVIGVLRAVRRRTDRRAWFPVLWFGATVLVLSLSNVKKNAYLLPAVPAVALTTARGLLWVRSATRRASTRGTAEIVLVGHVLAGVGFALTLPALIAAKHGPGGAAASALPPSRALLGAASLTAALAAGAPAFLAWCRGGVRAWAGVQATTYAVAIAVFFAFVNAPFENRRSAKPLCRMVEPMLDRPDTTLLVRAVPEEAMVYLPLGIRHDPHRRRVLAIVGDPDAGERDREWFEARLPGRQVIEARRIPTGGTALPRRWTLYEVTVDPRWLARVE